MTRLLFATAALALIGACAAASGDSALCTCDDETEKYDGEQCVASADFTAPACEPDERAVCGCDDLNYTSSCAAFTAGVEVKYAGACRASFGSGSGSGFGW